MNYETIKENFVNQKKFFESGKTLDINYRINILNALKRGIKEMEEEIFDALKKDLNKSRMESYMCEVGIVLSEISYMIKNIKKFSKTKKVRTPISQFYSKSYEMKVPYGTTLIISPWNYPFMLSLTPLVDAIAAGNVATVKPSEYSVYSSEVIKNLITKHLPKEVANVVLGDSDINAYLLDLKYDYIFFTGSTNVGKIVMEKASKHLTNFTLELGGKSPCIVDEETNLRLCAKRIVFGKFLNAGQTCIAPDYLIVKENIKDEFILLLKEEIEKQYGINSFKNNDYVKIINEKHFNRLLNLMSDANIVYGGKYDKENLKIEPTILDNIDKNAKCMQEEIFGPILPILTYNDKKEIKEIVKENENPLSLYVFSDNKEFKDCILKEINFGGGCINDTIVHIANENMGFGGIGQSGIGRYHGRCGFDTFSNTKSILERSNLIDLNMRYQPYTSKKENIIKKFLK